MEEDYMKLVPRYSAGEKGKRAIDAFPEAFAALVEGMEKTRKDILGDIFEGAITFGENGQFFTPEHICTLMAQITMNPEAKAVSDPAVGSGRNLLAAAEINPHAEFYGQDVDLRCVRMTAINLALRNLYGWVIWGDSLKNEKHLIYRTGFNGKGVIERIIPEKIPEPVRKIIDDMPPPVPGKQLTLF